MKYTVFQLRKFKMPFSIDESIDFSKDLNGFEDIIDSKVAQISETIDRISNDIFIVNAKIHIELVLECAISLDKIPYVIDTDSKFTYTCNKDDSDDSEAITIENNTLDTYDALLTEILCNKPMKSIKDGANYKDDDNDEEYINPAFSSLADLLKK